MLYSKKNLQNAKKRRLDSEIAICRGSELFNWVCTSISIQFRQHRASHAQLRKRKSDWLPSSENPGLLFQKNETKTEENKKELLQ